MSKVVLIVESDSLAGVLLAFGGVPAQPAVVESAKADVGPSLLRPAEVFPAAEPLAAEAPKEPRKRREKPTTAPEPAQDAAPATPPALPAQDAPAVATTAQPAASTAADPGGQVRDALRAYVDRKAEETGDRDSAYKGAVEILNRFAPKVGELKDGQHALVIAALA